MFRTQHTQAINTGSGPAPRQPRDGAPPCSLTFVSRAPLSFPKEKKWHREAEGFPGRWTGGRAECVGLQWLPRKTAGGKALGPDSGFGVRSGPSHRGQGLASPPREPVWCHVCFWFFFIGRCISFVTFSPVPFPRTASVEVVLGLILFNWTVPLGFPERSHLLSGLVCLPLVFWCRRTTERTYPGTSPSGTTASLPIKRRKMEQDTHGGV